MFIQPGAFSEEKDFNIKRSVSTEISQDIKARTGMSAEEIDMVLHEDADRLEMYSPIESTQS